jgi:hypothetical protein
MVDAAVDDLDDPLRQRLAWLQAVCTLGAHGPRLPGKRC